MSERVLFIVHQIKAIQKWAQRNMTCSERARELTKIIDDEKEKYDLVIQFEQNPWEEELPKIPEYTWDDYARSLQGKSVDIAGADLNRCVDTVHRELSTRGVDAHIRQDLTME